MSKLKCTRPFFIPDQGFFKLMGFGLKGKAPAKSCLFCDHMTDMFWDYTNGPYWFRCELNKDTSIGYCGECPYFREGNGYYNVKSNSDN